MSKTLLHVIFLLFFSFMIMFYSKIYSVAIIFILLIYLIFEYGIRLPFRYILILLMPIYFLFGFTYMFEYGFSYNIFIVSLLNSSITILKLFDLIILNIIFVKMTSVIQLSDSLNRLKLSKNFLFSIMILITIIPLVFKTASQIYDAQRLRGLRKRDFLTINGWILFLSPLFIHIFSYSQQIALQLELKNYENIKPLEENIPKRLDYLLFIFSIILLLFFYFILDGNLVF